jgi:hypothetical protein
MRGVVERVVTGRKIYRPVYRGGNRGGDLDLALRPAGATAAGGGGAEATRIRDEGEDAREAQSRGATSPHLMCARSPQSSHSRTALRPSRLVHMSHLGPPPGRRPLAKKKSSALQPPWVDVCVWAPPDNASRCFAVVPGLISVKRCTCNVDPPSVAAATDASSEAVK